jgi:hypothetical protein
MIPNLLIYFSLLIITIESLDKAARPGRETVMIPPDLSSPVIPFKNYFCRLLMCCGFCVDDSNKVLNICHYTATERTLRLVHYFSVSISISGLTPGKEGPGS